MDENNQDITQVKVSNTGAGYKGTFKVLYPEDSVVARAAACSLPSPPMCTSTSCLRALPGDGPVRQPPELPLRHRPQDQPAAQRHLQLLG